jgi:ketosteroid isomerase-like protein
MTNDSNALYRRWLLELWNGDLDVADELIADDFVGHWPDRDVNGRDALVDLIRQTREMMSDMTFELELGPLSDDGLVAARWVGEGQTSQGAMRTIGHDLLRVRDGRCAEYWVVSATPG